MLLTILLNYAIIISIKEQEEIIMKVVEIVNKKAGTKWEILKVSEDCYTAKLYEMYSGDWRFLVQDGYYTKDGIEFEFDIKIA